LEPLAPPLLQRSPHTFYPSGPGYRVFTLQAPGNHLNGSRESSLGLRLLFRGRPNTQPPPRVPGFPVTRRTVHTARQLAAPPLRFQPLQRLSSTGQRHELAGSASPTACAFRFSQPPGAFIRPEPTRPCFMPDPLLGLPFRAFFLPRVRTLSPAPLPSWRFIRLQGFTPRESPPLGPAV
jgi:hypothetical protein